MSASQVYLDFNPDTISDDGAWPLAVAEGYWVGAVGSGGWAWGKHAAVHDDTSPNIDAAKSAALGDWRDEHKDDWCERCGATASCPECRS